MCVGVHTYVCIIMQSSLIMDNPFPSPVLGAVSPSDLGVTLPHEHLLVDFRRGLLPPPSGRRENDLPFTLEDLGHIRRFP